MQTLTVDIFFLFTLVSIVILVAISIILWVKLRSVNQRLQQSIKLINDLYTHTQSVQPANKDLSNKQTEPSKFDPFVEEYTESMSRLHNDVSALAQRLDKTENRLDLFEQDEPQMKMYKKANQLASAGASIEDIMEACQLPRAEVEVLMGLQRK